MYIVYNYMSHYINAEYGILISMKGLYPGHNDSRYYPTRTQIEELPASRSIVFFSHLQEQTQCNSQTEPRDELPTQGQAALPRNELVLQTYNLAKY